ncbi:MAG: glycosyltransferase family 39 protein [Candidatus Nomurabacteria bacterium]|jgi:hypothetical protein|nr:glycosyltransferase family 39 protein [Candidatus Nomurabacteria bacterium]
MPKRKISDLFLYKHRYLAGYILLGVVFAVILIVAQFVTGGLSSSEMANSVSSAKLGSNFFSADIVNLPFKLLQWASISIFGLSVWSIKLPAVILAACSGVAIIFLLRRWSKMSVVIPAAILLVASSQFLFSAQDGTPNILYILLPVLILLCGHIAGSSKQLHLPALLATSALLAISIYTPFLIYFVIAIVAICLVHPRIRLAIRTTARWHLWLVLATFLIFIAPLILAIVNQPDTLRLVLTNGATDVNILRGFNQFITTLFFSRAQADGAFLTPVYGLPTTALMIIGFVYGLKQRHRTKYYVILGWLAISVAVLVFDPSATTLVFAPLALLLTKGLAIVIQKWYNLFPGNPYARVAGLAPIAFLIFTICLTSVLHFVFGYHYSPQVAKHYSDDLTLVRNNMSDGTVILAKHDSLEYDFYKLLERREKVTVLSALPEERPKQLIAIGKQGAATSSNLTLIRIVTSGRIDDANRLYIYR